MANKRTAMYCVRIRTNVVEIYEVRASCDEEAHDIVSKKRDKGAKPDLRKESSGGTWEVSKATIGVYEATVTYKTIVYADDIEDAKFRAENSARYESGCKGKSVKLKRVAGEYRGVKGKD